MSNALKPGALYRIVQPNHYDYQWKTHGFVGEFQRMVKHHCSLHGDFIGWEAEFMKVKPSGKRSYLFRLALKDCVVTEVERPENPTEAAV